MLTIRDCTEADLPAQDAYFEQAPDDFLIRMGVDPHALRSQKRDISVFRSRAALPLNERPVHAFVFEDDGQVIGTMTLKQIRFGDSCDAHGHIYNSENRQKNYGKRAFILGIDRAFELFQLKMIFFEPSVTNPAPNALLQSLGLSIVDTYDTPAGGILAPRRANRYEVHRDYFYEKLKPSMS